MKKIIIGLSMAALALNSFSSFATDVLPLKGNSYIKVDLKNKKASFSLCLHSARSCSQLGSGQYSIKELREQRLRRIHVGSAASLISAAGILGGMIASVAGGAGVPFILAGVSIAPKVVDQFEAAYDLRDPIITDQTVFLENDEAVKSLAYDLDTVLKAIDGSH